VTSQRAITKAQREVFINRLSLGSSGFLQNGKPASAPDTDQIQGGPRARRNPTPVIAELAGFHCR
jgi:hypothetical protein